jgi:hypothetical protein
MALKVVAACISFATDTTVRLDLCMGRLVLFEVLRVSEAHVAVVVRAGMGVRNIDIVALVDHVEMCAGYISMVLTRKANGLHTL